MDRLSIKQYRTVDLIIFALLVCVLEYVNVLAVKSWFPTQLYTVSMLLPLVLIVMMRWNAVGAVIAAMGGAVFALVNNGTLENIIVYAVGNAFLGLAYLLPKYIGKDVLKENVFRTVAYVLIGYVLIETGRAAVAMCFGRDFGVYWLEFVARDMITGVIAIVVVLIARRQNGLFEDQVAYIRRIQEEEKEDAPQ